MNKKQTNNTEPPKNFQCSVCGFVYTPEAGDPEGGVEPGTMFKDIPAAWLCPECGAGLFSFEPLDSKSFANN
ncbi:MAG: rubredoxin [Spirochaetia bacterium]